MYELVWLMGIGSFILVCKEVPFVGEKVKAVLVIYAWV
jgi:hypothetical protein